MGKTKNNYLLLLGILLLFTIVLTACKNYTPEQEEYIKRIEALRKQKNLSFMQDPNSPFNQDPNAVFHPLNYYDVNPDFVFKSKLTEYENKDTVTIYGTKGEERKAVRYGYLTFTYKGKQYKLNVYENDEGNGQKYYSIWFTDRTTNKETYGVGRYLKFSLNSDPNHEYIVDFNLAFNPFCAYSANYTCAIPTKEDYIDLAIEAGEKKFHD